MAINFNVIPKKSPSSIGWGWIRFRKRKKRIWEKR